MARPAAQDRAVVLRIEPLRVSTLTGLHPSREQPAAARRNDQAGAPE